MVRLAAVQGNDGRELMNAYKDAGVIYVALTNIIKTRSANKPILLCERSFPIAKQTESEIATDGQPIKLMKFAVCENSS